MERDPDVEGATGMSASKMRDAEKKMILNLFKEVCTSFRDKQKLFGLVRKSMNVAANMQSHGLGTMKPIYLLLKTFNGRYKRPLQGKRTII